MRRAALPLALLTACGGPSEADEAICAAQAADMEAAQAAIGTLADGRGQIQTLEPALADALSSLTGYVAEDERLDRAVTRARADVQMLYDDVQDQRIGDQVDDTATAALAALADVCGSLS